MFAANYVWPQKELGREMLLLVLRLEQNQGFTDSLKEEIVSRNRKLPDFKRVTGCVLWDKDFPRTASLKIKRDDLAQEIRSSLQRSSVKEL